MSEHTPERKRRSAEEFFRDWERKPWEPRIVDGKLRRHGPPQPTLTEEQAAEVIQAAYERRELWIASGKLEILGPRRWRYYPGEEKVRAYLGIKDDD